MTYLAEIISIIKKRLNLNPNEKERQSWLATTLSALPAGARILDAGAGELQNKPLCSHLVYVSQDICQYEGTGNTKGLQTNSWDTSQIDIVCDITEIPEGNSSFDAILCSEVFEHLTDPLKALLEFKRLLKPGGNLIITAPFASMVHFAPFHYATGFSRYWYEHHLPAIGLSIYKITPNGDWFGFVRQEILRLPRMAREHGDWLWPVAYLIAGLSLIYFGLRSKSQNADDLACFGWHVIATKK